MKKEVFLLVLFLIGLGSFSASAEAQAEQPVVEIQAPEWSSKEFAVAIKVNGVEDLYGWSLEVVCQDTGIQIIELLPDRFPQNGHNFVHINERKDYGKAVRLNKGLVKGSSGSGEIAVVKFKVLDASQINFKDVLELKLSDSTGGEIPYKVEGNWLVNIDEKQPLIQMDPVPFYTNAEEIQISGTLKDENPVCVKVNGLTVETKGGVFSTPVVLKEGVNEIRVTAVDGFGNQSCVAENVILDRVCPEIKLEGADNVHTHEHVCVIKGKVVDNYEVDYLEINGEKALLDEKGCFKHSVFRENYGQEILNMVLKDRAGNVAEAAVKINFMRADKSSNKKNQNKNQGAANPGIFPDINDHWARDSIESLYTKGYIKGFPDGNFKPDTVCSRGQFITMLMKIIGYTKENKKSVETEDIPEWGKQAVLSALEKGILKGYRNGGLGFDEKLTRNQAAVFLCRAFNFAQTKNTAPGVLKDFDDIPEWAQSSVKILFYKGLLQGFEDNTFRGNSYVSRAQAAVLLDRVMGYKEITGRIAKDKKGFRIQQNQESIKIISPQQSFIITTSPTVCFKGYLQGYKEGSSYLKFEGKNVTLDKDGSFEFDHHLDWGMNELRFSSFEDTKVFTIYYDDTPPIIDSLSSEPGEGGILTENQLNSSCSDSFPIKVKAVDFQTAIDKNSINLTVDGQNHQRVISYVENELGYQEVTLAVHYQDLLDLEDGYHVIKAQFPDLAGNIEIYEAKFVIDTKHPELKLLYPSPETKVMGQVTVGTHVYDVTLNNSAAYFSPSGEANWMLIEHRDSNLNNPLEFNWDTRGLDDGEYDIKVTAEDKTGKTSENTFLIKVDNTPPKPVEGLKADVQDGSVKLTWNLNGETDLQTYKIYRSEDSKMFELIGQTKAPGFADTPPGDGTFFYKVSAVDDVGNISEQGVVLKVKVENSGGISVDCVLEHLNIHSGIRVEIAGEEYNFTGITSEKGIVVNDLKHGIYTIKCTRKGYLPYTAAVNLDGSGFITIKGLLKAGDVNGDQAVDDKDLKLIFSMLGIDVEDPQWSQNYDYNTDGYIDLYDMVLSSRNVN